MEKQSIDSRRRQRIYRVAETADYYRAHKLAEAEGFGGCDFRFPTIVAYDDGVLVGFIATADRPDMVLAGPLVIRSDRRRPWLAMRLLGLYEMVLKNMGITTYIFNLEPGYEFLKRGMERYFPELEPYAGDGDRLFYKRTL